MRASEAGQGSATICINSITVLTEKHFAAEVHSSNRKLLLSIMVLYTSVHNHFTHNNKEVLLSVVTGKILI